MQLDLLCKLSNENDLSSPKVSLPILIVPSEPVCVAIGYLRC
jgi:hypothetical protein